jgi:hypothetical protein
MKMSLIGERHSQRIQFSIEYFYQYSGSKLEAFGGILRCESMVKLYFEWKESKIFGDDIVKTATTYL